MTTPTPRLTAEREREIRRIAQNGIYREWVERLRDLLAEIDALREERRDLKAQLDELDQEGMERDLLT